MNEAPETPSDDAEHVESEQAAPEATIAEPARVDAPDVKVGIPWRGLALSALGLLALALQMASSRQIPHGGFVGAFSALVLVFGLLDAMGLLRPTASDTPLLATALGPVTGEGMWRAPVVTVPLALAFVVIGILLTPGNAHDAWTPILLVAFFILGVSAIERPAMIPALVLGAIYLPRLGSYGLWDPWETHYGEVAREILSRDDWISLWWAQEEWFWSKPIYIFWTEAWTMSAFGVSAIPDTHPLHPEWALRAPIFVITMIAVLSVQSFTSRVFGRRAGILAALVVGSMPHFYLLAHQAITDMPLTASLTIAVCLLGLALHEDANSRPVGVRVGAVGISSRTVAMGTVLLIGIPPLVYLLTRNFTFFPGDGFSAHMDVFLRGSAGNDGVSGNVAVAEMNPVFTHPQPVAQAVIWMVVLAVTAALVYRAQSRRGVYLVGFYTACAIGLLGKGIPGFALPGLVALLYLIASRRWSLLLEGELRVGMGSLLVLVLGMPWYVAMYVRHGRPFVDRILIHDHINRLASGVHGDSGPIDYFVSQLGYGMFPWIGLAPIAVLAFAWLPRRVGADPTDSKRREATVLIALWAMAGFTLFNAMVTKFHHYIFPVVPPTGLLIGVLLDRLMGDAPLDESSRLRRVIRYGLVAAGTLALFLGVAGFYGDPRGVAPASAHGADYVLTHGYSAPVVAILVIVGVALIALSIVATPTAETTLGMTERGLAASALGAAVVVAFAGRDLSWSTASHPHGHERFINLFIYLYTRPWPEYLDYRPVFSASAILATLAVVMLAWRRLRPAGVTMLLAVSLLLTAFSVNLYLPDLAEHWGTRSLVRQYYDERHGRESLIAFQMNWKGENFYTGNRVQVFQDVDTSIIRRWLDSHQGTTFFALSEHGRVESLRTLLPAGSTLTIRSTPRDNNKFALLRIVIAPRAAATPPPAPPAHVD